MSNEILYVPQDEKLPKLYDGLVGELDEIQKRLSVASLKIEDKIPELIEFAGASQHPKVYEALAKVAATISIMARDSANIVKQKHEILNSLTKGKNSQEAQTINNSYTENKITMTHSEAMDLIRKED